jgi:hypothetical protein
MICSLIGVCSRLLGSVQEVSIYQEFLALLPLFDACNEVEVVAPATSVEKSSRIALN